jgi:predicted nucleic acid-binding protein
LRAGVAVPRVGPQPHHTTRIGERAAAIAPSTARTLDAIHPATALSIGTSLTSLVTHDGRLADAARALGLPVVSPA